MSSPASSSIVAFEPSTQLVFKKQETEGLETSPVQDVLKITNLMGDQDVLFRVQTTSPLTYRVKPSNGRILAGESVSVQVVMIAESTKQDKFLIKYVPISPDTTSDGNFIELFKTVEATSMEHRLKCQVLQADGAPLAYGASPAPQQEVPGTQSVGSMAESQEHVAAAVPIVVTEAPRAEEIPDRKAEAKPEPAKSTAASVASSPAKPVTSPAATTPSKPAPTTLATGIDPRDAKLKALETRNADLLRQVEDLQKIVGKAGAAGSNAQVPPEWIALLNSQTGFPPVLVILIALFSFLVGLLF